MHFFAVANITPFSIINEKYSNLFTFALIMNLLIDIGNTLAKIAISDGKSILTEFKLRSIDVDFC